MSLPADIAKCPGVSESGQACPVRGECVRYTTPHPEGHPRCVVLVAAPPFGVDGCELKIRAAT